MREAGFEPANPKDVGLSDAALTTNRFAPLYTYYRLNHIFRFLFCWVLKHLSPPFHIGDFSLNCFSTRKPYNLLVAAGGFFFFFFFGAHYTGIGSQQVRATHRTSDRGVPPRKKTFHTKQMPAYSKDMI